MFTKLYVPVVGLLAAGFWLATPLAAQPGSPAKGKVSALLLGAADASPAARSRTAKPAQRAAASRMLTIRDGYVAVQAVSVDGDAAGLLRDLEALGLRGGSSYKALAAGMFPVDKLAALADLPSLRHVRAAPRPRRRVGSVTSQGDRALGADAGRAVTGLTGAGIKVGILSDSYDALGGAAAGIASGDLPAEGVEILDDFLVGQADEEGFVYEDGDLIDEGRGMAEIIHDVAPGSRLAFHTAFRSLADFASGVEELAAAGCDVIVDDIGYLEAPFFSPGPVAQAVNKVTREGVAYFSAAGNDADDSFQQPFRNSGATFLPDADGGLGEAHNFGGGDIRKSVTIGPGDFIFLGLQWDDPFFSATGVRGAETDLDIFAVIGDSVIAAGADFNIGADPVEFLEVDNLGEEPLTFDIVVTKFAGPDPTVIKYLNFGFPPIEEEFEESSPTLFGHPNAAGAIAVGAAFYAETPAFDSSLSSAIVEGSSSRGGLPIFFTEDGRRLRRRQTFRKPEVTGPDGGNTTFFPPAELLGFEPAEFDVEGDGFPNFFGTSAAAPHLAGVAALIQEGARGFLPPKALEFLLIATAEDMDDPLTPEFDRGFDFKTGFGFVRADRALGIFGNRHRGALAGRTGPLDEDDITALLAGDERDGASAVAMFPNPSDGTVTLYTDAPLDAPVRLSLHDAIGREVFRESARSGAPDFDLGGLPAGMYLARIDVDGVVTTETLVLE